MSFPFLMRHPKQSLNRLNRGQSQQGFHELLGTHAARRRQQAEGDPARAPASACVKSDKTPRGGSLKAILCEPKLKDAYGNHSDGMTTERTPSLLDIPCFLAACTRSGFCLISTAVAMLLLAWLIQRSSSTPFRCTRRRSVQAGITHVRLSKHSKSNEKLELLSAKRLRTDQKRPSKARRLAELKADRFPPRWLFSLLFLFTG